MKRAGMMLFTAFAAVVRVASAIGIDAAESAIEQANHLCEKDHGRLWGVSLCGPLLIVDPTTREAFASRPATGFAARNGLFVGHLPESVGIANTALDWDGARWIMLMWPLPQAAGVRGRLLMHESWHRVQDKLGLAAANPPNTHLDSAEGRARLRLEWRALAAALCASDQLSRRRAITDAIVLRRWRRQLSPTAESDENALELNEGLAEYTGRRLGGEADAQTALLSDLKAAESADSFVRSFAYHSGPAYGLLLDRTSPGWRSRLDAHSDLGVMLADANGIALPENLTVAADIAGRRYGADTIVAAERARDREHRAILEQWKTRLVDGPVLVLPLHEMKIEFDPNTLIVLPSHGTVYPKLKVRDDWGTLVASNGALVDDDWSKLSVATPKDASKLQGDGWALELAEGWSIVPGDRPGDLTLRRTPAR